MNDRRRTYEGEEDDMRRFRIIQQIVTNSNFPVRFSIYDSIDRKFIMSTSSSTGFSSTVIGGVLHAYGCFKQSISSPYVTAFHNDGTIEYLCYADNYDTGYAMIGVNGRFYGLLSPKPYNGDSPYMLMCTPNSGYLDISNTSFLINIKQNGSPFYLGQYGTILWQDEETEELIMYKSSSSYNSSSNGMYVASLDVSNKTIEIKSYIGAGDNPCTSPRPVLL